MAFSNMNHSVELQTDVEKIRVHKTSIACKLWEHLKHMFHVYCNILLIVKSQVI